MKPILSTSWLTVLGLVVASLATLLLAAGDARLPTATATNFLLFAAEGMDKVVILARDGTTSNVQPQPAEAAGPIPTLAEAQAARAKRIPGAIECETLKITAKSEDMPAEPQVFFGLDCLVLEMPFPEWRLGPFVKHPRPVLSPSPASKFTCPVLGKEVRWEAQNVYNHAAVVRDGKVCIFYRADDRNPALKWGRTCRIGIAWIEDGTNFTRHLYRTSVEEPGRRLQRSRAPVHRVGPVAGNPRTRGGGLRV